MSAKSVGWFIMTLLATGVAGYALTVALVPNAKPELVAALFQNHPIVAPMHFLGGAIAILTGALQLNARLRTKALGFHRWLGRIYVIAILFGGAAGLIMAFYSFAGPIAATGFAALAVAWLATTLNAYRHIRAKDIREHRYWMIRSYALTLAAVTLRIYLPVSQIAGMSFAVAYPIIAWACWVPNSLVAEWVIRQEQVRTMASPAMA